MGRQRRRRHSAAFKAESIAACRQPGVSIAAVAMSRSLNANLLRRWVVAAERQEAAPPVAAEIEVSPPRAAGAFVPIALTARAGPQASIRIEVRRGGMVVSVKWPQSSARECGQWLRELLR